jgi:ATP-dependent Lon protease
MSVDILSPDILRIALISLDDGVVMPELSFYLDVARKDAREAINRTIKNEQYIFLANPGAKTEYGIDFHKIGVLAHIKQYVRMQNKGLRVLVEVVKRAELLDYTMEDGCFVCHAIPVDDIEDVSPDEEKALEGLLKERLKSAFELGMVKNNVLYREIRAFKSIRKLVDSMADYVNISDDARQDLLATLSVRDRAMKMIELIDEGLAVENVRREIMDKVNKETADRQREYALKEQLKIIKKELGEPGIDGNASEFTERLNSLGCNEEVYEKIAKEIKYYKSIPQNSSESSVLANYIETMLSYPWNVSTEDNDDINESIDILDKDHYGLEEVKERIIDYLAVHILSQKGDLPIICLVGPPGTGKTSIARSIARATSRKYVRLSLGGVRDEAEIRGHRKTYVGAMPGKIVQSMIKAKANNPLMLLDEIDKVSSDYRGDVSSALLEVLDREQNSEFSDHYMGVPVDLSNVLFIATANDISTVPGPLLDRMEIINIPGYTENEKYNIAKLYLVDKTRKKNGLTKSQFRMNAGAIREIIRHYTREAGVRNLERNIDKVCRKACRKILTGELENVSVTKNNITEYLGSYKYRDENNDLRDKIGAARGLAWTSVGGVTLDIEVNVLPGKGDLKLTGKMGDVMKESAYAGMSYIRSLKESLNLGDDYFMCHDFHIHIPEGAVPKDGPSAGITMALALYSAIFNVPVSGKIAMTGEITLRGEVLPIGGLKEKLLAAKMIGVKTVLIPAENEPDYQELDDEIKSGMDIRFVENMRQVINLSLAK